MTSLRSLTSSLGALLMLLGIAAFYGTEMDNLAALIPAFFGLFFAVFGILARKDTLYPFMMRAALGFAVLGGVTSLGGVYDLIRLLTGASLSQPAAIYAKTAMLFMCLMYILVAVKERKKANQQNSNH